MKKLLIVVTVLLVVVLIFSSNTAKITKANTNKNINEQKITVVGNGEVSLEADTAIISISVQTENEALIDAYNQNTEKIDKIYEILKGYNIEKDSIETKNFFAQTKYDYTENEQKANGYYVSNELIITSGEIDKANEILSKIIDSETIMVNGISFTSSQMNSSYKTALTNALEDAKTKAESLSNNANMQICEIVEESFMTFHNLRKFDSMAEMQNPFFDGKIIVRARVLATFTNQIENATNENTTNENTTNESLENQQKNDKTKTKTKTKAENEVTNDETIKNDKTKIDTTEPENVNNNLTNNTQTTENENITTDETTDEIVQDKNQTEETKPNTIIAENETEKTEKTSMPQTTKPLIEPAKKPMVRKPIIRRPLPTADRTYPKVV